MKNPLYQFPPFVPVVHGISVNAQSIAQWLRRHLRHVLHGGFQQGTRQILQRGLQRRAGLIRFTVVFFVLVVLVNILMPVTSFSQGTPYTWLFGPDANDSGRDHTAVYGFPSVEKTPITVAKTYWSQVTVYNSVPEQTDSDPFTTASGEQVRNGIVAANCLPFGTLLRMPELFGDKIFVVKDRLAANKTCYIIDIWQEVRPDAKSFGAPITKIEILSADQKLAEIN